MNTTGKKYGGRKKGTPNKEVKDIREAFQVLIENNLDKMDLWINQLAEKNPEKAINTILRLSDFILPKLTKTEITQLPKDEYANMTDEELDAEIKKNIEKYNENRNFLDSIDKTEKKGKGSFERYFFNDEENDVLWNLLENKSVIKGENNSTSLFDQFGQTMSLIPEFKSADYILKIETEDSVLDINEIVTTISNINTISLSYVMDKNKIKTKSNLIF